jgi:hypothetical protein
MIRTLRYRTVFASLFASLAVLMVASTTAQAQVARPFRITGDGLGPEGIPLPGQPPRPHWALGIGHPLGVYSGEGEVQTDSASIDPSTGVVTGEFGSATPFVFTAHNGDKLACYYGRTDHGASQPGTFTLIPVPYLGQGWYVAHWVAEFVPYDKKCTGNFRGVTGSWIMYATSEPFQPFAAPAPVHYWWEGEGTLTFPRGR